MKSLSSPELAVLVEEWQDLIGARINKVFQHDERHISLQLHAKGKIFLHFLPGIVVLSPIRLPSLPNPTPFLLKLRQHIENGKIRSISQGNFDRVLNLEIEKTSSSKLIFELFGHGNVILADADSIITVLERRDWKTRSLRPGQPYSPPPAPINTLSLDEPAFTKLVQESTMDSLVKFLAAELGLGKNYAEALCARSKISKDRKMKVLTETDIATLFQTLKTLLAERDHVVIKLEERPINATPFNQPGEKKSSFSDALAEVFSEQISETPDDVGDELKMILSQQDQMVASLVQQIDESAKTGETIYTNYTVLEEMMAIIAQHKQKGWPYVKEKLKHFKEFDYVDEGKGELVLKLQ